MIVTIQRRRVDVARSDCGTRECFRLGFDKGSYTPGRGYTSYHTDAKGRRVEKPVCMTRHLHGCPMNSVCSACRTVSVKAPGERCDWLDCGGELIAREDSSR